MTARAAGEVDLRELGVRMREVAELAERGGADLLRLEEVLVMVHNALVELEKRRRGDYDPRRVKSLALSRRMRAARQAGASIAEIATTFNRRKSAVYRLLGEFQRSLRTVSVLNPRRSSRAREGGP